jgi:glycosyltransferase involved in cell wall biosynthesis
MTTIPTISILTPTRNRCASFLPLAIASVQALRLSCPFEHVVVDDGSDDDTAASLAEQAANDPRIRWIQHATPCGVAAARNSAARHAHGDLLVDLDDDDLLTADGVEARHQYLREHPEFWAVHANALKIDEHGSYLIGEDVRNYFCGDRARCAELFYTSTMIPNASTAMYRRAALLELGGWDESLACCEDYDLWLRSVERYGPPGFLDTVVALYRKKADGLGSESIRSGVHACNQRLLQRRHAHCVSMLSADDRPSTETRWRGSSTTACR